MGGVLFHIAFPVDDLEEARRFYVDGLGCMLGRASGTALTLELKGHQIVAHLSKRPLEKQKGIYPRHFGLIFMLQEDWKTVADQAQAKGLSFYQKPRHRFPGSRLEHLTFMLEDPSHNLLEFKHYKYESAIFGNSIFHKWEIWKRNKSSILPSGQFLSKLISFVLILTQGASLSSVETSPRF